MTRSQGVSGLVAIGLVLSIGDAFAQMPPAPRCGAGVRDVEAIGVTSFPRDQIFCPLLADPKETRSFVTILGGSFPSLSDPVGRGTTIGSVGLGDNLGLVRWGGPRANDGLQLDVIGSIFAQFDIGAPSNDLINADYLIGLPLTFRKSGFSLRLRLYHQSSHLGDEFLLRDSAIDRENLSFESVGLLVSQEAGPLRVYVGAERVVRREPGSVPAQVYQGGFEIRSGRAERTSPFQWVSGLDLKTTELHDWAPAISGRTGLEIRQRRNGRNPARLVSLLLEFYTGPSPYGQFFQDDISYVGAGLHFGL